MSRIEPSYFVPCKQPKIGPNGEGQGVPWIRLGLASGLTLLGAACLFKGRRLRGGLLTTLGAAIALGEFRVLRNLPSTSSAPQKTHPFIPPHLCDESQLGPWLKNPNTFRFPRGTAYVTKDPSQDNRFYVTRFDETIPYFYPHSFEVRPDGKIVPGGNGLAKSFDCFEELIQALRSKYHTEFHWFDLERVPRLNDEIKDYCCQMTFSDAIEEAKNRMERADDGSYCIVSDPTLDPIVGTGNGYVMGIRDKNNLVVLEHAATPLGLVTLRDTVERVSLNESDSEWEKWTGDTHTFSSFQDRLSLSMSEFKCLK